MIREKTLVLVKPDAIARKMAGEIITRFEKKGLKVIGCKMMKLDQEFLRIHYAHLVEKEFYKRIEEFMSCLPVIALCVEGFDAVRVTRDIVGDTNGRIAGIGTIRGDYSMSVQCNLIHASDSKEAAITEISRFFNSNELFEYRDPLEYFHYSSDESGSAIM